LSREPLEPPTFLSPLEEGRRREGKGRGEVFRDERSSSLTENPTVSKDFKKKKNKKTKNKSLEHKA